MARRRAPRLLVAAAEMVPLAKTGGLADVCGALPAALRGLGVDARVLLPGYESALDLARGPRTVASIDDLPGGARARLLAATTPDSGVPVLLLDMPALFRRAGTPYLDEQCNEWPDNARRFGLFGHAAARIALGAAGIAWRPDLVHCHDWHAGLVPLLLAEAGAAAPPTLFTIHNVAFQGNYALGEALALGVPERQLTPAGVEFHGCFSFLKSGIVHATRVSTVSPTYAREIRTPEFGFGMDGVLAARSDGIAGILNGIDVETWDPACDRWLAAHYDGDDPAGKAECKRDLQQRLGLLPEPDAPLALSVSRVTWQKMADVVLERLPGALARHPRLQFALHGCGEPELERGFLALAAAYPGRVAARIGYTEEYAHRLHAGGDLLLHGSRFEPCGLAQQYAMRYGTLPLVRRTGGLADSVIDADAGDAATGFVFDAADGSAFEAALERALALHREDRPRWCAMQRRAMARDASWQASAREYLLLFDALAPGRGFVPAAPASPRAAVHRRQAALAGA